jgi:hypothetical protein
MNQHVKTWVGTVIIVIIAITAGAYVYVAQKNNAVDESTIANNVVPVKKQTPTAPIAQAPTIDQTAGWQTYRNDKYGFEFQYSKDWTVSELTGLNAGDMPHDAVYEIVPNVTNDSNKDLSFEIRVSKSNDDPKTWYKDNYEDTSLDPIYKGNTKSMVINNVPVFYAREAKKSYVNDTYVFANRGIILFTSFREISREGNDLNYSYSSYLPEFEHLVNSIKFYN